MYVQRALEELALMDVAVLLDVRPALQADTAPWHLVTAIRALIVPWVLTHLKAARFALRVMLVTPHPMLVLLGVIKLSATCVLLVTT